MRAAASLVIVLAVAACGGSSAVGSASSVPRLTSPNVATSLTGSYGLLFVGRNLELIGVDGSIAASVPVQTSSFGPQACGNGMGAWTLPGVSASDAHVYFRDGDNKIRMLIPPASSLDVTAVPGGTDVVSGFSVSPDDQRIAVSVETFSPDGITDRLYVEDLRGGGHHSDIYSASAAAGKQTFMLWPMGWHAGRLVLAVWVACTFEPVLYPSAWHVADSVTADRVASIGDRSCTPDQFPSPAGVACFDYATPGHVRVYDWSGAIRQTLTTDTRATELSTSGDLLAFGGGADFGTTPPSTSMLRADGSGIVTRAGHTACLWIDDDHVLARDAVIEYPSGTAVTLAQGGRCAGRFPGGL